tara:strand:- start:366 stop:920 length:555 start_codon:yes stop_codon:yes gene_type:complete
MKKVPASFFNDDTVMVARNMVGKTLVYESSQGLMAGVIKETEAYTQDDPACHAYLGKQTKRNRAMFESPGTLYIYMIYGMYYCLNFVCEEVGKGCAVLIRELIPTHGMDLMKKNRDCSKDNLLNGPSKLVQAFGISPTLNGCSYDRSPLFVCETPVSSSFLSINHYPRIGISKGVDCLWRFRGE